MITLNEVITKDYRRKSNLEWFNDKYFIAIYDQNDNYINIFEDIESTANAFNIPVKKILEAIRNNTKLEYKNIKLKLFVYPKEKIMEEVRRR